MSSPSDTAPSSRVALVTGGNSGMGRAIAQALLEEGGEVRRVYLGVRENRSDAEALAASLEGRIALVDLDVTDPESWATAVNKILEREAGRLDILANNAGFHKDNLLASMPREDWDSVLAANLDGVFHGCQAVLRPMMGQRWGRIVNISSLSALLAPRGQTNYAAAKAGVVALTQSLAKEVARSGITVNAVCPGYVETDALSHLSGEEKKGLQRQIPMRRFGRPDEVAAAVRFLACEAAGYITGSTLKIDGGIF